MIQGGWWRVTLLSGVSSFVLVLLLAMLGPGLLQTALLVAVGVVLLVAFLNPVHRYFRAFWSVLGFWSASTIVPTFQLNVEAPSFLAKILTEGPSAVFHICAASLAGFLVWLDWRERGAFVRPVLPASQRPAHELFTVNPVNTWGENIYTRRQADGIEKLWVCVHFNLWSKHTVEIVNVDLRYGACDMPGRQTIVFDSKQPELTDASFRLQHRTRVEAGSVIDVRIGRDFTSKLSEDYGASTVRFEVSSTEWPGIRHLEVGGRLAAGGELADVKVMWRDNAA